MNAEHFLNLYKLRQKMQEDGITNPSTAIKQFVNELVDKLSNLDMNEEITIKESSFFDSKGNLIAELPLDKKN